MSADRTEMNNLAARQPERLRRMVAQWEAWAHRAKVLPWIWQPAYGETAGNAPKEKGKATKRAEE